MINNKKCILVIDQGTTSSRAIIFDYKGKVLFQASLAVELNDSAISLSQKIQELEHQHYASTIEKTILLKK